MHALQIAHQYFDAWNRRDPAAIVATFAEGGVYTDPGAGTLTGPAIGEYAGGLFAAFPDLQFEIVSAALAGENTIAAQWLMTGTNTGSMRGAPPTGKPISVPGADFIVVEGDQIRSVTGYFDSAAVPRQLDMQVIVQPKQAGPFQFGYSVQVHSGKTTTPGAFGLTMLHARSPEDADEVRSYSRRIAPELLSQPGFIGVLLVGVGSRMITISAWEKPEQVSALRSGAHKEAMARFFADDGVATGGSTSIWQPLRLNPLWVRDPVTKKMEPAPSTSDDQPPLPYW
jgi:steroid delta-isomerase-like uncharacterized protein